MIDRQTREALILGGIAAVALWYVKTYQAKVSSGQLMAGNIAAKNAIRKVRESFPAINPFLPKHMQ